MGIYGQKDYSQANLLQALNKKNDDEYSFVESVQHIFFNAFTRVNVDNASIDAYLVVNSNEPVKIGYMQLINEDLEDLASFGTINLCLDEGYKFKIDDEEYLESITLLKDGYPNSELQGKNYPIVDENNANQTLATLQYYVANAGTLSFYTPSSDEKASFNLQWNSANEKSPLESCLGGGIDANYTENDSEPLFHINLGMFINEENMMNQIGGLEAFVELYEYIEALYTAYLAEPNPENLLTYMMHKNNYDTYYSLFFLGLIVEMSENYSYQYAIIDNFDYVFELLKERSQEN